MSKRKYDWRKGTKIHPAADMFPMMGPQQLDELADNLKDTGLQHQPVYFVSKTGERLLVDGRNRLEAMCRAGINPDLEGREIHEGKVDPYSYVIAANIKRRHLTRKQGRDLIAKVLAVRPEKSDRAIAKELGKSHSTVAKVRANGQVGHKITERKEATGRGARGVKPGQVSVKQQPGIAALETAEPQVDLARRPVPADQAIIGGEAQAHDLAPSNVIAGMPSGDATPASDAVSTAGALIVATPPVATMTAPSSPQRSNDTASASAEPIAAAALSRLEQWKQLTRNLTSDEFTAAKAWFQQYTGSGGDASRGPLSEFTEPRAA